MNATPAQRARAVARKLGRTVFITPGKPGSSHYIIVDVAPEDRTQVLYTVTPDGRSRHGYKEV